MVHPFRVGMSPHCHSRFRPMPKTTRVCRLHSRRGRRPRAGSISLVKPRNGAKGSGPARTYWGAERQCRRKILQELSVGSLRATGLDVFDKTLQTTNIWLDEIMAKLGPDRQVAWH